MAVKGLLGKSGCTRMVQGGYNVALAPGRLASSAISWTPSWAASGYPARTSRGGWSRVRWSASESSRTRLGCFFDRNPDGTIHQKAFAGQSFDRTVHKGDLTGIEIINRVMEQVLALDVHRLEEHRAIELIPARDGSGLAGVLLIDVRTGGYRFVAAKAVLLATGAGPTMYLYHTPSGDKSCDGLAMALRAGLTLRDMEMVQFHPTGLLAGPDTRMTGTVLEEGLRGAGGYLLNGDGERFMERFDPAAERATRDVVSPRHLRGDAQPGGPLPMGGVFIEMKPISGLRSRFAEAVPRHGQALRGLRLRPRGRPSRGRPHRALHDGRGRCSRRTAPPKLPRLYAGGRGLRRGARREPARRQRGRELDRVRGYRRRDDGGATCALEAHRGRSPDRDRRSTRRLAARRATRSRCPSRAISGACASSL